MTSGEPITPETRAEVIRLWGRKWSKTKIAKHTFMDRGTVTKVIIEELRSGRHAERALELYDKAWSAVEEMLDGDTGNEPGQIPASVKVRCSEMVFDTVIPPEQKVSLTGKLKVESGAFDDSVILQIPEIGNPVHHACMVRNAKLDLRDQFQDYAAT